MHAVTHAGTGLFDPSHHPSRATGDGAATLDCPLGSSGQVRWRRLRGSRARSACPS